MSLILPTQLLLPLEHMTSAMTTLNTQIVTAQNDNKEHFATLHSGALAINGTIQANYIKQLDTNAKTDLSLGVLTTRVDHMTGILEGHINDTISKFAVISQVS